MKLLSKILILFCAVIIQSVTILFIQAPTVQATEHCAITVSAPEISIGDSIDIRVKATDAEMITPITIRVMRENGSESQTKTIDENIPHNQTRTKTFDNFTIPDSYIVSVTDSDMAGDMTVCILDPAFIVNDPAAQLTLEAPTSPVMGPIKTIPSIILSGLPAGTYEVKLVGMWQGENLGPRHADDWFVVGASGKIIANNVCDDGSIDRTEADPVDGACGDDFVSGTYGLRVQKQDHTVVGYREFEVDNPEDGDGAGHNPCGAGEECSTAIGNIPTDPAEFASRILAIGTGVAGGIALILMVIGSIRVLTSSGDPQRVAGGRDMIMAAVAGLLFLILSVLILRFIGVEIIGIGS